MEIVSLISLWFIPILIGFILMYGTYKKVPTYESFVEGGKEGIKIAVSIIPFLVGMLVAISIFRASGALDYMMNFIRPGLAINWSSGGNCSPCFHKADFWNGSTWNDE